MVRLRIRLIVPLLFILSCAKDKGIVDKGSNYPKDIAAILLTKCAISGCHTTQSKDASAGLSLISWEDLFAGGRGGPVVIPFRPDFSTLCYYTNTTPDQGPALEPRMPLGLDPLSKEDYLRLKDWILLGAPDAGGSVKFSRSANKLYVTNQLCDLVAVIDGESRLPMRYINVGTIPKTEFPVCIKVSPDKKSWFVTFLASQVIQKYHAGTDSYESQIDLGEGIWSSFEITADSRYAFCVDNSSAGKIACVDLKEMKVIAYYTDPHFVYPKAIAVHTKDNKLYVGQENGNYISVVDFTDPASPLIKQLILDGSSSLSNESLNDPGNLIVDSPSGTCYVACYGSKEIKIIDVLKDSIIGSVFLNARPTSMDLAHSGNKLFVTCNDDSLSFPGNLGSVRILDVVSKHIVKTINPGYQPNGIRVNSAYGYAAVVNSNISPKGPRPHHVSACAGRNGYITFIDLNTLELIPLKRYELAVYPYAIDLKN